MALRSRPLKFSLLQATHLQNRSCRSHIERRVTDHGVLEKRHSLPLVLTECMTCSPATEREPFRKSVKNSRKENGFDLALLPSSCRDNKLQPWKDQLLGLKQVTNIDVIASARNYGNQTTCDNSLEKRRIATDAISTGRRQFVWPSTLDDICGSWNASIKSATTQVSPVFTEEFVKYKLVPSVKDVIVPGAKPSKTLSMPLQTNPIVSPCGEQNAVMDSDTNVESALASDFMYFMEYFMNGAFALEKSEHIDCPTSMMVNGALDQHMTSQQAGPEIPGIVYYGEIPGMVNAPKKPLPNKNKPSLQQLENLQEYFAEAVPAIFVKRHDYRIYTPDIVFENNYFATPYVTRGVNNYAIQLAKLRIMAHFRFANVRIHILKMTVHEEDGSVRIRWRLSGIPQSRAFMFWKFLPWRYSQKINTESEWHDGFSTFYLNKEGLVTKHRMDIVMPEEEVVKEKSPVLNDALTPGLTA